MWKEYILIHNQEVLDKISKVKIFDSLKNEPQKLLDIIPFLYHKRFKKNDVVFKEGDLGDSLFIIYSGSVRIVKHTSDKDPYTVVILQDKENVFFGEICLLEDSKRTATVICETDCEFLILNRSDFISICESDNQFGMYVMREIAKSLSFRLRKADEDIITLFNALISEVEGKTC